MTTHKQRSGRALVIGRIGAIFLVELTLVIRQKVGLALRFTGMLENPFKN